MKGYICVFAVAPETNFWISDTYGFKFKISLFIQTTHKYVLLKKKKYIYIRNNTHTHDA